MPDEENLFAAALSRRSFLKSTGLLSLALGIGGIACIDEGSPFDGVPDDQIELYNRVVPGPPADVQRGVLRFFTPHEAETVEALTARIIPGSPEDPGAREADVTTFLDIWLSVNEGYWQPTYREPPFARSYEGDAPEESARSAGVIWVPEDEMERYGYQSLMTPRETFRIGLASVDRHCQQAYGRDFVDLTEAEQDDVIEAMEEGEAEGFSDPEADEFFETLQEETINAMFSDPAYGGNRDMVGWRLIDYPGAQRGYTPAEMLLEINNREPQSLEDLHPQNPGEHRGDHTITPLQNADQHRHR